jgi:hypothetical protein
MGDHFAFKPWSVGARCIEKGLCVGAYFEQTVQTNNSARIIKIEGRGDKVSKSRVKIQNPIDFRTRKVFWAEAEVRLCGGVQ